MPTIPTSNLILAAAALAISAAAAAAPLNLAVSGRTDDERFERARVEAAYLGHPLGPIDGVVEAAIDDAQFELDAAKLQVKLAKEDVGSADAAKALAVKLEKAGHAALIVDWPAAWISAAAAAVKMPIFNAGEAADALRQQDCRANVFHTLPSERMRADALGQWLVARKWQKVLVLHGTGATDQARLATVQNALKRYGLKPVAAKPFKLSGDPRERDLANPLLLTAGLDYDVLWVVDADGEFARTLPYRISLPRPVVGDAAQDWAAWMAAKAVLQAAIAQPGGNAAAWMKAYTQPNFSLDGSKGARMAFRPWDRQLRQPVLLTDGQGVISQAPVEGLLHPTNVLDTLGADAPEKLCKAPA